MVFYYIIYLYRIKKLLIRLLFLLKTDYYIYLLNSYINISITKYFNLKIWKLNKYIFNDILLISKLIKEYIFYK